MDRPDVAEALKKGYAESGCAGAWRRANDVLLETRGGQPDVAADVGTKDAMARDLGCALDTKVPGDLDTPSSPLLRGAGNLEHPGHGWTATVTLCGRLCFKKRKVNISQAFAGQRLGVKQVTDQVRLVTSMKDELGYLDAETCRVERIDNPFSPEMLSACPEWTRGDWLAVRDDRRTWIMANAASQARHAPRCLERIGRG
jgi:hypothetical protein